MRTIKPLRDQVLVKQDAPKEKLGSLFVPQGVRESFEDFGTVVAVGSGRVTEDGEIIPVSVKPGDRVLFKRRPASALGDDWKDHLMLKDDDMLAILEDAVPEIVMDAKEIKTDTTGSAPECECH